MRRAVPSRLTRRLAPLAVLALLSPVPARAMVGTAWNNPLVAAFNGVLIDEAPALTVIQYIAFATSPGDYGIAFDYKNELSPEFAEGSFPDTAFASLYFTDDLADFSIEERVFDGSQPLMDIDHQGPFNVGDGIAPSPGMTDWYRFSGMFTATSLYTVVAFELDNLNGEYGDSIFRVANVALIPEPAVTGLLAAGGMLVLAGRRRRAGRSQSSSDCA